MVLLLRRGGVFPSNAGSGGLLLPQPGPLAINRHMELQISDIGSIARHGGKVGSAIAATAGLFASAARAAVESLSANLCSVKPTHLLNLGMCALTTYMAARAVPALLNQAGLTFPALGIRRWIFYTLIGNRTTLTPTPLVENEGPSAWRDGYDHSAEKRIPTRKASSSRALTCSFTWPSSCDSLVRFEGYDTKICDLDAWLRACEIVTLGDHFTDLEFGAWAREVWAWFATHGYSRPLPLDQLWLVLPRQAARPDDAYYQMIVQAIARTLHERAKAKLRGEPTAGCLCEVFDCPLVFSKLLAGNKCAMVERAAYSIRSVVLTYISGDVSSATAQDATLVTTLIQAKIRQDFSYMTPKDLSALSLFALRWAAPTTTERSVQLSTDQLFYQLADSFRGSTRI